MYAVEKTELVDGDLRDDDGLLIHWRGWVPSSDHRASVVVSHGAFEHGGRYGGLAEVLTGSGIALYAIDHRGHGRSQGRRSDIDRLAGVARDLAALVATVPLGPSFLLGYSMGGVIALECVLQERPTVDGLILLAPAIDASVVSPAQFAVARFLSRAWPGLGIVAVDPEDLTGDPQELSAYRADPLVHHGRETVRTVAEIIAATRTLPDRLADVTMPVLLLHGDQDVLAAPAGSELVHRRVSSPDRTITRYPDAGHDLLHDHCAEQVSGAIRDWVLARI
jgi:acylglycerol lipase